MSSATAAAGGTGNGGGGKSNNYNSYSNSSNSNNNNNNNNNQFKSPNLNIAAAAASGGEITAGYESSDDDGLHLTSSSFAPRDPKLDEEVKKHLQVTEPSWQVLISSIKTGKEAVAEGNDDPNLTKWSKKYLPGVLDAVVKLQEHVIDTEHFGLIFNKLYDIIEIAVHGRPPKENDDFLSSFRECNELVLNVLCAFVSLRGGLYFEREQFKDQYDSSSTEFMFQLIAVNNLLLDCSPTPLNDDPDEEQDAPVPAGANSWKEYIATMIQLKQREFVNFHNELAFWSERLKSAINYVDRADLEEKKVLQLNNVMFNKNNKSNNNNKDPTSVEAIRQDLAAYYNDVEFSMSQSSSSSSSSGRESESGEQSGEAAVVGKFEDFFCNLRLKKRQQKEGEQQSATDGEFVSASHLPTRLRSAAHTVLVTGPGGAGKTVALKHICIQQGVKDSVIVFVPLKELRGMSRRIESIEDLFKLCSAFAALSEEQIEAIVEKRIPVIFAFDGFDEVHNAQEEDKNIAHFLSDMIDPKKRKFSLENKKLTKLVRSCDRVIISSREERIASANCNLDSAEARPLVDELAVQLWTNSEVERFCLRFFSNAFKNQRQEQEQQNHKGEKQEQHLAKAVRTATNDVISSLASPLMDSWRGLPLAVTLLSQLRSHLSSSSSSASSENKNNNSVLDNMSPARAYSLVLEMHWSRSEMRVADRLLRCKKNYLETCSLNLNNGVTPELFELVLNCAAEASFKQLLSRNSNVTEISFSSSSSSSSSSSNNTLPLWAALLRETGLIRVENNNSKATFSHRSWIEFLCARHAAASSTENLIDLIPWDESKFASVWLLLADFARSGTFEKYLSVQRFSFAVMSKYAEKIKETVKEREGRERRSEFDDKETGKASISLLARITNIIKPDELFSPSSLIVLPRTQVLHFVHELSSELQTTNEEEEALSEISLLPQEFIHVELSGKQVVPLAMLKSQLEVAKDSLDQLPKLVKRKAVTCSKCKTHFAEAPADWKCNKCSVLMWNADTSNCEICNKSFGFFTRRHHTRCCGKCVCSGCIFEGKKVSSDKYFCEGCVSRAIVRLKLASRFNCIESKFVDALQKDIDNETCSALSRKSSVLLENLSSLSGFLVVEETLDENDTELEYRSPSQKQTIAANSFTLHLRWLAELCVAEGALDCFKFIEEKHPEAIFGVFEEQDLEFAKSEILSPALARAFDHLDRPAVSACVEYIIDKYNVDVQLEDALRVNSLVGVTRAIKKLEKDNSCGSYNIMGLFSGAIAKSHFDVVAAMLRCRRDEKGRFLWCHTVLHPVLLQLLFRYLFPQDLQFRVWCEEKKDFETSTLSDHVKLLESDLSSDMKCQKFEVKLSDAVEQHLWIQFFHLFEEVVHSNDGSGSSRSSIFLLTPSNSPGHLRVLDLTGNWNVTDEELASLVGKCSHLEEIDLSCTKFGDASLKALATCGSTLRSLNLSGNESCTDVGLAALVSKCTQLEVIDLWGGYTNFTDASLEALATCASTLRSLNLRWNRSCTDIGLVALVSKCTQLEGIDLSCTKFGDASLKALATCASTLRSLNLSGNESCTDVGLAALVSKCIKLEEINLSGSDSKFGDASLKALATCASTLRSLNLRWNKSCTDIGLVTLVSKCTQLEEIDLSCTKFGDASLKALATCGSTLRSLNLFGNESCTDVGLAALVSKCTRLEEIKLSGFGTKFGDASLRALAASPSVTQQKPPTLVKIDLEDNKNFTDAGIDVLKEAYGDFWNKVEVETRFCANIKNK